MKLKEKQKDLAVNWILGEGEGEIWGLDESEGRYHR